VNSLRAVRTDGVAAIAERVLADLDVVVARMGSLYAQEIPEYAELTPGQLAVEVLPVSRRLVTTFLACVVDGRSLTAAELEVFAQSGRARLMMGMPLESVLHAYRIAGREAWTALCSHVAPAEVALLADLGARWMDIVDRTSSALAQAYLAASHERLRHVDARRRELLLLRGSTRCWPTLRRGRLVDTAVTACCCSCRSGPTRCPADRTI
jgi:hypothetical protein